MFFEIDDQTRDDLNLYSKIRDDVSVFGHYDLTQTKGGKDALLYMFNRPLSELLLLNNRKEAIMFLVQNKIEFKFEYLEFDFIEFYLANSIMVSRDNILDALVGKIRQIISPTSDQYIISRGVDYLRAHLIKIKNICDNIGTNSKLPLFFKQFTEEIQELFSRTEFQRLLTTKKSFFSFRDLGRNDRLIRKKLKDDIREILKYTYLLDAFSSVAFVARQKGMSFVRYSEDTRGIVKITGLFHLFLKSPVLNDFSIDQSRNICLITGPNMAGKSTFLKSIGICIYLAHIGFPVPASNMEMSLFNGLLSTINLNDNINRGYSHFYSEVKRLKDVFLTVKERKRVIVIFDELFKGTNVKDAFDASLLIIQALTKIKQSLFFISTHITEVTEELRNENKIHFKCFTSELDGDVPKYSYELRDGISSDRLGSLIVKKAGIIEIIEEITQAQNDFG